MLDGDPETYASFTDEYYEKTLNVDLIRRLYLRTPLTPALVAEINSDAEWQSVRSDAKEIGYPINTTA